MRNFLIIFALFLTNLSFLISMDSKLQSFLPIPPDSDFSIHNIPFGVFSTITKPGDLRCASRIGDFVIDLRFLESKGILASQSELFKGLFAEKKFVFCENALNEFMRLGKPYWQELRKTLQHLVSKESPLVSQTDIHSLVFIPINETLLHLPAKIGDYTDFYSSKNHAYNVGVMFRGANNALQPNWLHLPVGYHGRASSVVVSGTEITRPRGQAKLPDKEAPFFTECKRLDFELEMSAFIGGKLNTMGHPIKVKNAEDSVFGFVLMNDWSARDLQAWEYVPLGPFNAKNFATTISPWVVTVDALEPFRVELEKQEPEPLEYLKEDKHTSFDIQLEVSLQSEKMKEPSVISRSNYKFMYWSISQQLAHHSVTGCNMNPGDMLASGTISGVEKGSYGSMLELAWSGKEPIKLSESEERTFINDGDILNIKGFAEKNGIRVGFGECKGKIKPALPLTEYY